MSNKLPIEVKKDNIFKRFFYYIKSIFEKKTRVKTIEKINVVKRKQKITELYKLGNFDKINADIIRENNRKRKIEEIIQIIEKEPELLNKLDIPKLEVIDKYYKDKIIEYRNKLSNT